MSDRAGATTPVSALYKTYSSTSALHGLLPRDE
jgi:hypothetical protein